MNDKQKSIAEGFKKKSNREKLEILAVLSKPWIAQGAITRPVNTLEEIFDLQDKSITAIDSHLAAPVAPKRKPMKRKK